MNKEIEIPEGYEARIEGNKVIFEPKKSEDEKIRKEIIDYFYGCIKRNSKSGFRLEQYKSWIAYLEKQKEQKPLSTEETELNSIAFLEQMGYTCIPSKEQKPAEWSKEYLEEGLRTRFAIYTYKNEDGVLYLSNVFVEEASRNKGFGTKILQATEKVAETIGAITIRLKVKRNSPANDWYRKRGYKYLTVEGEYDWLEKNLEYMKPSKHLEKEIMRYQREDMDRDTTVRDVAQHFAEWGAIHLQPEVDLGKDIDDFFDKWDRNSNGCFFDENGAVVTIKTIKGVVKHFLNARKKE